MPAEILRFGEFALDRTRLELRRGADRVTLAPLALKLLLHLVDRRPAAVSFEELRRDVWEGVSVADASIYQAVKNLRRALSGSSEGPKLVETVRGYGYRFVGDVTASADHQLAPMQGREPLLGRLRDAVERAGRGAGTLVLISGEAGVGKTRVAEEVAAVARAHGLIVARGRARSRRGSRPYAIWIDVLQDLSRQDGPPETRARAQATAQSLQHVIGMNDSVDAFRGSEERRYRTMDEIRATLRTIGAHAPTLLVLDDLHEAGQSSLEVLEAAAQGIANSHLLLLGAYRASEMARNQGDAEVIARLVALPSSLSEPLRPLPDQVIETLLGLAQRSSETPPAVIAGIAARSRGNPFYALEILRHFEAFPQAAARDSGDVVEGITTRVRVLLEPQLDALDLDSRRCLRSASAIGTVVPTELLARMLPEIDVHAAFDRLTSFRLLVPTRARSEFYEFPHDLIREAVYDELVENGREKRDTHRRVAEALIDLGYESPQVVARHIEEAVPQFDEHRAVSFLLRAAEESAWAHDDDQAWALYERALSVLRASDDVEVDTQCQCLIGAGFVGVRSHRSEEGRGYLKRAVALARTEGLSAEFCTAALGLAYRDEIIAEHEDDTAVVLREALSVVPRDEPHTKSRLLAALARKLRYRPGSYDEAVALADESVRLARATGDASALAQALEDSTFVRWSAEDIGAWTELNRELVEAAAEADDIGLLFRGVKGLATAHMEAGAHELMLERMERCAEMAKLVPSPFFEGVVNLQSAAVAFLRGDLEEGERHALQAMTSGVPAVTPLAAVQLYYHRLETGRIGELEDAVRDLHTSTPEVATWGYALARLLAAGDRREEALTELHASEPLAAMPRDRNWLAAGALGVESAALLGQAELAASFHDALRPYARLNVVLGHAALFYGNTSYFIGLAALAAGDPKSAREALDDSLRMHHQMKSVPWIDRSERAIAAARDGARTPPLS